MRPGDFERRAWVALAWARDWALFRGEQKDPDLAAEFNSLYSEQERRDILATVTAMDFSNRFMNTVTGQYLKEGAACALPDQELTGAGPVTGAEKEGT